jgi:cleavage stimulation factor subunit 3
MLHLYSFLLNFAYAEQLEARKEFAEVHTTFDKFLTALRTDLEEREKRIQSANSSFSSNLSGQTSSTMSSTVITEAGVHSNTSSFATQTSEEKPAKNKELAERRSEYSLVWIMYMRFGRRVEGLQSMRVLFSKARRDRWIQWEVYEAAGMFTYSHLPLSRMRIHGDFCSSFERISLYEGHERCQPDFREGNGDVWRGNRLCFALFGFSYFC